MKIKKITPADIKRVLGIIATLKPAEKDETIAYLLLFADRAKYALNQLIKHSDFSKAEKKEIEDSISVGPQWLNYTRRVVRSKK